MSDEPKPWSIRGVTPEVRNAALAAAKRDNVTIGEWLDRAIRSHIKNGRNPGEITSDKPVRQGPDLSDAERIVGMIAQLSSSGAPIPKTVASKAYAVLRESLKDVQQHKAALPPPAPDEPSLPL
jgi:hypothetical protein